MKVLQLYDGHEKVYDGKGSVPGVVWNIATEVSNLGHEVTVLERRWNGLAATAEHEGVSFHRLDLSTGADEPWTRVPYDVVSEPFEMGRLVVDRVNFAIQSLRYLRHHDFDVIHVHLPFAATAVAALAPWLRKRMVFTAHLGKLRLNALADNRDEASGAIKDDAEDVDTPQLLQYVSPDLYLAKRVAKTTVMNPAVQDSFATKGAPEDRLEFIPNGVDVRGFRPDTQAITRVTEKYGLNDGPVVLFLGTIMPRKGVTDLVDAAGQVITDHGHEDTQLLLAGNTELDEEYTDRVRSTISEAGIEDNVTFTGFVDNDEIPELYGRADVFVLPSLEEGFPLTPLEAMAAKTPIVATKVGGIPWQFDDGTEGRLIPPRDPDEIAAAIVELLDDEGQREAMANAAVKRSRSFAWPEIAGEFEGIYEEVAP